jgi:type VI protein secretion system component Hcp
MSFSHHYLKLCDKGGSTVAGDAEWLVEPAMGGGQKSVKSIEIIDWNWTAANKKDKKDGEERGGGKDEVEPSVFSITKAPDRASIKMLDALHSGEVFKQATFTLFEELHGQRDKSSGGFHLEVVLTDVQLIEYDCSATAGDKAVELEEEWVLNYTTITFKYEKGSVQSSFTRKPDASTESSKGPVEEILTKAKALDPGQRKELVGKLGSLD